MASQLPRDFEPLVAKAEAQPPPGEPPVQPVVTVDEFLDRVARRALLDRLAAARATEAVLETLGERIVGGEVDDLLPRLPEELRPPLELGNRRSHGAARRMSLGDFVREVAEREGVTPDVAREHARAVFATLREVIGEKEMSDVEAQLPDEYSVLLARP
jgi:uncharacterized protein (DUF2267 family)